MDSIGFPGFRRLVIKIGSFWGKVCISCWRIFALISFCFIFILQLYVVLTLKIRFGNFHCAVLHWMSQITNCLVAEEKPFFNLAELNKLFSVIGFLIMETPKFQILLPLVLFHLRRNFHFSKVIYGAEIACWVVQNLISPSFFQVLNPDLGILKWKKSTESMYRSCWDLTSILIHCSHLSKGEGVNGVRRRNWGKYPNHSIGFAIFLLFDERK